MNINIKSVIFLLVALPLCAIAAPNVDAADDDYQTAELSDVYNPSIPKSVKLANQKISLDRVDMYERYDRELTSLAYGHGSTLLTIKRANKYFSMIVPLLKKNNIPQDFVYLAAIESNFNIRAYSPAGAAGLWQFMPATGRQYGLEVNEYVDERYDPEKSTIAATKYLNDAYAKYGDWCAVAASYNAGMGRISSLLNKQQASSVFDLYLVDETSRYIFRILAIKEIFSQPKKYGFHIKDNQLYQPIDCEIVEVDTAISDWSDFAISHGILYSQLREYNPWIRATSLPNKNGKKYFVKIPQKKELFRSSRKNKTYNENWTID